MTKKTTKPQQAQTTAQKARTTNNIAAKAKRIAAPGYGNKPRLTPADMTTTEWKKLGRPAAVLSW